jgi:PAS domain S-box-containing protein
MKMNASFTAAGTVGNPLTLGKGGGGDLSVPGANSENGSQQAMLQHGSFMNPMQSLASSNLPSLMPTATHQTQPTGDMRHDAQQVQQQQQQQQQMLWQQALQQLTRTNLAISQSQFNPNQLQNQQQVPPTNAGTLNEQHSHSYLFPGINQVQAGATNGMPVPSNVPIHFFQAMAAPAPVAGQAVSAPAAPIAPNQASHDFSGGAKRRPEEASGSRNRKMPKLEPSVISSFSNMSAEMSTAMSVHSDDLDLEDFPQDKDVDYSKMTPAQRRRHERNLREQQRSYRISQQIKGLREVLTESNIPFKPNKFSILVSIVDYTKQLQSRAIMLDSEYQKLAKTIRETNELVTSGQNMSEPSDSDFPHSDKGDGGSDLLLVQGLDYSSVFENCPFAIGVAALDGRVISCNATFQSLIGASKREMLQQSLFMFIRNHQELFEAMASLLKEASAASETGEGTVKEQRPVCWSGHIVTLRSQKVSVLECFFCDSSFDSSFTNKALLSRFLDRLAACIQHVPHKHGRRKPQVLLLQCVNNIGTQPIKFVILMC